MIVLGVSQNEPAGQGDSAVLPDGQKLPSAQSVPSDVLPLLGQTVPVEHATQASTLVAPLFGLYVPAGHMISPLLLKNKDSDEFHSSPVPLFQSKRIDAPPTPCP